VRVLLAFYLCLTGAGVQQPRWQDPHLRAAEDYIRQKQLPKAAEILEIVIGVEPRCGPEVYLKLGDLRQQLAQPDEAILVYQRGAAAYPGSALLLKRLGHVLFRRNPTDPAAGEALKKAAAAAGDDAEAHFLYGQWACMSNLNELCARELNKAATLSPSNDNALMQSYTLIGMAEDKLNHTERAEEAFRKALEHNLKLSRPDPNSALEYAQFLSRQSREADAAELVVRILAFAPYFGPAHLERAKMLAQRDDNEQAAVEAELALKYAGDDKAQLHPAHVFLAKTYFALNKLDQARQHQEWIQANP
jgi:Flp pilus assembly protein TadD